MMYVDNSEISVECSHIKGSDAVSNERLIFRDSRLYLAAMLLDQRGQAVTSRY